MTITQNYITQNDSYKNGKTITPKGVMVHSTATPGVMAATWPARWNKPGVEVSVHAFVDDTGVVQTLPWNRKAWHCGTAYSGGPSANSTHISFEMCEPSEMVFSYRPVLKRGISNNAIAVRGVQRQLAALGLYTGAVDGVYGPGTEAAVKTYQESRKMAVDGSVGPNTWVALQREPQKLCVYDPANPDIRRYFEAVYANAVALTAMLCKQYTLDPLADGVVICHSEGYKRKVASNHADVMHWFPLHGIGMDRFRQDVKKEMAGTTPTAPPVTPPASRPVLKKGAYGPEVKEMQERLIQKAFSCGPCGADGNFGAATDAALRGFQKAKGLVVDGSCGPLTWAALLG